MNDRATYYLRFAIVLLMSILGRDMILGTLNFVD